MQRILQNFKRKVNRCLKSIDLENFQKFLWEKKKTIDYLTVFYISHESDIKTF